MFLGFQLQVWYFIENIVFQAPVCIIWDFFEPLRTVIDHFRTLWSNFVHFCLFWTQCDLERHRKMNSKILFSLLGLFYGMSRGAFRGVSFFFCKFGMWTSFTTVHPPLRGSCTQTSSRGRRRHLARALARCSALYKMMGELS